MSENSPPPSAGSLCLQCGAVSFNPNDAAEGYCARCHMWTGAVPLPPDLGSALIRLGASLSKLGSGAREAGAMVTSELGKALARVRELERGTVELEKRLATAHERTVGLLRDVATALRGSPTVSAEDAALLLELLASKASGCQHHPGGDPP
jgi:hypothetical protein